MKGSVDERGAISIKALLTLLLAAIAIFVVVNFVPVYVEQRQVLFEVEELARVAAVRSYKDERINQDIKKIRGEFNLPDDSISLVSRDKGVQIVVGYSKTIDLLVTTYTWRVDHTAVGKEI